MSDKSERVRDAINDAAQRVREAESNAALRVELREYDELLRKLGRLLDGVAAGLQGPTVLGMGHDWAHLPELAKRIRMERDMYEARALPTIVPDETHDNWDQT